MRNSDPEHKLCQQTHVILPITDDLLTASSWVYCPARDGATPSTRAYFITITVPHGLAVCATQTHTQKKVLVYQTLAHRSAIGLSALGAGNVCCVRFGTTVAPCIILPTCMCRQRPHRKDSAVAISNHGPNSAAWSTVTHHVSHTHLFFSQQEAEGASITCVSALYCVSRSHSCEHFGICNYT